MNRKFLGLTRAAELAELRRFEDAGIVRPFSRLRVWLGTEDGARAMRGAGAVAAARSDGRYEIVLDLGRHDWLYRMRFEFDSVPGNYEVYYHCDLAGNGVPEGGDGEWSRIFCGRSLTLTRLCAGLASSTIPEEQRDDAHEQEALFGRYVKLVCDHAVTAVQWSVVPDRFVDLSHLIEANSGIRLSDVAEYSEGRFARPELSVTLKAAAVNFHATAETRDVLDLEELLDDFARLTYEIGYWGWNWERPAGFEGSGYWPKFAGYVRRAGWGKPENLFEVLARAGRREVEGPCSLPMVERMPVEQYLREVVTVDAETGDRICGVGQELRVGTATQNFEYVGQTREFGQNWFGQVVAVDANDERVYGVCWTGESFAGVVLKVDQPTESYGSDRSMWYLVRWDAAGREIERKALCWRISSTFINDPKAVCVRRVLGDITMVGERLLIAHSSRSLKLSELRLGYGSDGLFDVPVSNWESLGDIGTLAENPEQIAVGVRRRALSISMPYGRAPVFVAGRPDGGYCVGILRNDRSNSREFVDIDFWAADGTWQNLVEGLDLGRFRVGTAVRGESGSFWLALTGASWIGHQGSDPGLQVDWVDRPGWSYASNAELGRGALWLNCSFDGAAWSVEIGPDVPSDYLYTGLCEAGGDVFAFGFGESGGQELARVSQFSFGLENGQVLSSAGGDVTPNVPEFRLYADGQVLQSGYELNRDRGTVVLLRPFGDDLPLRASYDYLPTVDLVTVTDRARWDVVSEVAFAHGLQVRFDEVGRLIWGVREVEELFVAAGSTGECLLGRTIDPAGLAGIVPESVTVSEATLEEDVYDLGSAAQSVVAVPSVSGGRAWTAYKLQIAGSVAGVVYRIRFRVQEFVPELHLRARRKSGDRDSSQVLTRVVVRSTRRVPSELVQRMETVLRISPRGYESDTLTGQRAWTAERKLEMAFARVVAARADVTEWNPKLKIFERPDGSGEKSGVQISFDDPLLTTGARVLVYEARMPLLYSAVGLSFVGLPTFRKVVLATPADHDGYFVWLDRKETFRICTDKDFGDMTASTMQGGAGNLPNSAADVHTREHFYIKKMNSLASGVNVFACHADWVEYAVDSAGRMLRGGSAVKRGRGGAVVRIRPQDENGCPLLVDSPYFKSGLNVVFADAHCAVTAVVVLPEGVRVGVETESRVANRLGIEVVGTPVAEAEIISAVKLDSVRMKRYGKQERLIDNPFVPNYERAGRIAAGVMRRAGSGKTASAATRMSSFVRPGDVGWVTDERGVRRLLEVQSVVTSEGSGGSETVVAVKQS